jgi:metal-responsive CopG/Arc/MetJ family transcriptional regulator
MKTAISIPDEVFHRAEELAKSLGLSRSELYSQAVANFLKSHRSLSVTNRLNLVYSKENSSLDPSITTMQSQTICPEQW